MLVARLCNRGSRPRSMTRFIATASVLVTSVFVAWWMWEPIQVWLIEHSLERAARQALTEKHLGQYAGTESSVISVNEGSLKRITIESRDDSVFSESIILKAPCEDCFFFADTKIILEDGHGRRHWATATEGGLLCAGAITVITEIHVTANCERQRTPFAGGCRSVVAVAAGYGKYAGLTKEVGLLPCSP